MVEQENSQPESMEDILSSIRETVEGEAAAVNAEAPESTDDVDVDAMMAEHTSNIDIDDIEEMGVKAQPEEALDLSAMLDEDEEPQMAASEEVHVPTENAEVEEVIDIAAFNATGEETTAAGEKAENARELYKGGEVDTEMMEQAPETAETEQPVAEEPAMEEDIVAAPEATEEEVTVETPETSDIEAVAEAATAVLTQTVQVSPSAVHLPTAPSADGLQVTFPVEVLATALRPLVKDWVQANLPDVVERLVKEELSKLANQ
jgi:cell pole-organizing protein PopZ